MPEGAALTLPPLLAGRVTLLELVELVELAELLVEPLLGTQAGLSETSWPLEVRCQWAVQ